jgi:hypothetical protein
MTIAAFYPQAGNTNYAIQFVRNYTRLLSEEKKPPPPPNLEFLLERAIFEGWGILDLERKLCIKDWAIYEKARKETHLNDCRPEPALTEFQTPNINFCIDAPDSCLGVDDIHGSLAKAILRTCRSRIDLRFEAPGFIEQACELSNCGRMSVGSLASALHKAVGIQAVLTQENARKIVKYTFDNLNCKHDLQRCIERTLPEDPVRLARFVQWALFHRIDHMPCSYINFERLKDRHGREYVKPLTGINLAIMMWEDGTNIPFPDVFEAVDYCMERYWNSDEDGSMFRMYCAGRRLRLESQIFAKRMEKKFLLRNCGGSPFSQNFMGICRYLYEYGCSAEAITAVVDEYRGSHDSLNLSRVASAMLEQNIFNYAANHREEATVADTFWETTVADAFCGTMGRLIMKPIRAAKSIMCG